MPFLIVMGQVQCVVVVVDLMLDVSWWLLLESGMRPRLPQSAKQDAKYLQHLGQEKRL